MKDGLTLKNTLNAVYDINGLLFRGNSAKIGAILYLILEHCATFLSITIEVFLGQVNRYEYSICVLYISIPLTSSLYKSKANSNS